MLTSQEFRSAYPHKNVMHGLTDSSTSSALARGHLSLAIVVDARLFTIRLHNLVPEYLSKTIYLPRLQLYNGMDL